MFRDTKTSRFPPWVYWGAVLKSPLASLAAEAGQRYPVRSLLHGNILIGMVRYWISATHMGTEGRWGRRNNFTIRDKSDAAAAELMYRSQHQLPVVTLVP